MKNFIRKYGLTILGAVFTIGGFLVDTKKVEKDQQILKADLKKEILEELKEGK